MGDVVARKMPELGRFPQGSEDADNLEEFAASDDIFRSFGARQKVRKVVCEDSAFLAVYEAMVKEVLLPWLKALVLGRIDATGPINFSYQYPPTLRVQPGRSEEFKRPHRDAEYGHQAGELNFWMPLTNYTDMTEATLWVESSPDVGDYQPLAIDYGTIAMFHGTLCRHKVPANASAFTRVSMDFRVGIGEYFDLEWVLPGVKGVHGRREVDCEFAECRLSSDMQHSSTSCRTSRPTPCACQRRFGTMPTRGSRILL